MADRFRRATGAPCPTRVPAMVMVIALSIGAVARGDAQRVAAVPAPHQRDMQRVTLHIDNAPIVTILQAIAQQAGLNPAFNKAIIPPTARVTLHVRDVTVADAFQQVLRGTGLVATVYARGDVVIMPDMEVPSVSGGITGRVLAATSRLPLRGAKIGLDGSDQVTETAEDGRYQLRGVSAGSHVVTIKLLGYAKATRTVVVQDNVTTTVDVLLDISATPLDQVVVTGTLIPTERKAVPNAMTVITAKDIEQRGITKIDQLFRGDIPGLFAQNRGSLAALDEVAMFSRGATALSTASAGISTDATGQSLYTNPIKTYVDGVELADPKYLSQIDPKSIERIEILTGPQASTIYGSNAINGVMQIFTKRGSTSKPQLTATLLSGFVQNNFSHALTPQHDYSAQINGLEGRFSYNAGGSWNYVGPWTPAKQTARTSGFGGGRLVLPTRWGETSIDATLRQSNTENRSRGVPTQAVTGYRDTGWYTVTGGANGVSAPTTSVLTGQTVGLTATYKPTSWWSHEFGVGSDASDVEKRVTARSYASRFDTTLSLTKTHTERQSLRYTSLMRVPVTTVAQMTFTAGVDGWQNLTTTLSVSPQALTGTLTGTTSMTRQPSHNTGGFVQTQLGVRDQLFVTYGLRAEWNPNYGAEATPNYAPRYGIAYTQDVGSVTAKLRASYGRSTRPPAATLKDAVKESVADVGEFDLDGIIQAYGDFDRILANPNLTPEYQQGGEGGLELYLGSRGSLVITRYNQTVDGLIANPTTDSVRSATPDPSEYQGNLDANGYGYEWQQQYVNIGSIRNQGWELQGSVNTGPFTTKGTYSWTKSRVTGITPKYRPFYTLQFFPQYQPGATFLYLPEHTWAVGMTYSGPWTTLTLNVTGTGQLRNFTDSFWNRNLSPSIRLPISNRLNVKNTGGYTSISQGYALADVMATHRFSSRVEGVLQVQNLADQYTNDYDAQYATVGRQSKVGLSLRW